MIQIPQDVNLEISFTENQSNALFSSKPELIRRYLVTLVFFGSVPMPTLRDLIEYRFSCHVRRSRARERALTHEKARSRRQTDP